MDVPSITARNLPTRLADPNLADARIEKLAASQDEITLLIELWDGKLLTLRFVGVLAFENTGGLGADLSHLTSGGYAEYLAQCAERENMETTSLKCFAFISAWSDLPALKIVAREMTTIMVPLVS
jgi:hypothetical protein